MADPATWAIIGTGLSAGGAIYQAQAASSAARSNANIADQNAVLSRQQAALEAARHRRQSAKLLAGIRTGYLSSGLTLDGSPLDVLEESALNAEYDNMRITYGGELKARGYSDSAALDRMRARNSETAGYLGASAALIGGYGNYVKLKPTGGSSFAD